MKKLDKLISENLQALIEAPCGVDPEEKWQSFKEKYQTELLVREKEGTDTELEREKIRIPFGLKFAYIAAGLVVAFTCCMMNPQVVSAFRDQVFKWVGQNQENELVISQIRNPVTPPGDYGGISFAEAQALALFDLQYPHYLPESLAAVEPQINVNVNEDGYSSVTFSFIKGEAYLKITQRQDVLQSNKNTLCPRIPKSVKLPSIITSRPLFWKLKTIRISNGRKKTSATGLWPGALTGKNSSRCSKN